MAAGTSRNNDTRIQYGYRIGIESTPQWPVLVFDSEVRKAPGEVKRIAVNKVMGLELEFIKRWNGLV